MTSDDIRCELEQMGFSGLGTRVHERGLGAGVVSTAGNSGYGITYDRDSGWGTYQQYTREQFLLAVVHGDIDIIRL